MNCTNCGSPVPPNTKFCPKCGHSVGASNDNVFDSAETTILGKGQEQQANGYQQQAYSSAGSQQPQYSNPQPQYSNPQPQQPPFNGYMQQPLMDPTMQPVSVGGWIGVFLLCCIPFVNIIMLFVWAFSGGTKKSLKNYARASLILTLISIILVVIISVIIAAMGINISYSLR